MVKHVEQQELKPRSGDRFYHHSSIENATTNLADYLATPVIIQILISG